MSLNFKMFPSLTFVLLAVLVLISTSLAQKKSPKKPNIVPLLTDSSNATEGQFPYEGYLTYEDNFYCSISIIHEYWVLTAAHCLFSLKKTQITVGTIELGGGVSYDVERFIVHKDYDSYGGVGWWHLENDILLAKLFQKIEFNSLVQPVKIAEDPSNSYEGEWAKLAGWGVIPSINANPINLQWVDLQIISIPTCRRASWPSATNLQLCTSNEYGKSLCPGDSGSPLVKDGVQIGIASGSDKDCQAAIPSLFTRVGAYAEWIKTQLGRYGYTL